MTALIAIAWFIGMYVSIIIVFNTVGSRLMVAYFPEGHRWWMLPAQLASLALFAALVHFNPF